MVVPYSPTSGVMANWYFDRYVTFVHRYSDRPGFSDFLGEHGRKIFLSATLDAPPEGFERWWKELPAFEAEAQTDIAQTAPYDGNTLRVAYRTSRPAYLIFVDNWDPDWRATVNGREAPILKSFGTFKAIRVEPAEGAVSFEYRPHLPHVWLSVLGVLLVIGTAAAGVRQPGVES